MREPSASHLPLLVHCAHPWTSGLDWPVDRSDAGELGTRIHRACEAIVTGEAVFPSLFDGLSAADRASLWGCAEQARAYLASRPAPAWREAETWLRYHVETGRAVRSARGVRQSEPGWWTAILDYAAIEDDVLVVRDWKTGRQEYTSEVQKNRQIWCQALAAASLFARSRVRVELVYLDRERTEADVCELGPLDLLEIADELRQLRRSVTGGPTPPQPGWWCTRLYCPLRGACSATQSALAAVQPLEQPLSVTIRDEAHARYILERLPGAEAALDAVKHAVAEYARRQPIDLGDGRVYGWRQHETRTVKADTPEQRAALASVLGPFGTEAVQQRTKYEVTIGAIEAAARKKLAAAGEQRGMKRLADQALAALEAVGGLKVTQWEKPEVFER